MRVFDFTVAHSDKFDILKIYAIYPLVWVLKLLGKPAFLTIADWESEAPRIHLTDYAPVLPPVAAESNDFLIQAMP
jgi:hypothetical protein